MPRSRPNRSNGMRPQGPVAAVGPAASSAVAPGGAYGSRSTAEAALAAAPMPTGSPPPPTPTEAAAAFDFGEPIMDPITERPDEPISHGLASGPGAGPEALGMGMRGNGRIASLLQQMAEISGNSALADIAAEAAARRI